MMPFLGGSQREWAETATLLGKKYRCITVDLPGFGEAANVPGYSVAEMADALIETVAGLKVERYLLVGHSMAGKVSAVAIRSMMDRQTEPLPIGLVLVSPSPPGPEPMTDSKRVEMLQYFGGNGDSLQTEDDRENAEKYIKANATNPIHPDVFERAVEDVLKMNPAAWTAWLEGGSKEDWAKRVGVLPLPTLLVCGNSDGALGTAAQEKHTLPHFSGGHLITLDSNHLIPMEQPDELAAVITNFLQVF